MSPYGLRVLSLGRLPDLERPFQRSLLIQINAAAFFLPLNNPCSSFLAPFRAVCGSAALPVFVLLWTVVGDLSFAYGYGWGSQTFAIFHRHKVSNPCLFQASGYRACVQEQPVYSTHRESRCNGYYRVSIRQADKLGQLGPESLTLTSCRQTADRSLSRQDLRSTCTAAV